MTLAVTGSTGVVGGMVARAIAAAGLPQRLLGRNPDRVPDLPGATTAACSYSDVEAARLALEGVAIVFMVSASESADRVACGRGAGRFGGPPGPFGSPGRHV